MRGLATASRLQPIYAKSRSTAFVLVVARGYADGVYRDCLYFAKDRLRTPELKLEMVLCISLCRLDRYFMAPFAVLD